METREILNALIEIWPELPRLVGSQWADIFPRVEDLLNRILRCEDRAQREWLVTDVFEILEPYASVGNRLGEICQFQETVRSGGTPNRGGGESQPQWERDLKPGIQQRLQPKKVTRYTDIAAPGRLSKGRRGSIVVGLNRALSEHSVGSCPLLVEIKRSVTVRLACLSDGVEVLGEHVRDLWLEENGDPRPVVFFVVGHEVGFSKLVVDFIQDGSAIGTVRFGIEIVEGKATDDPAVVAPMSLDLGGPYVPPADFELRVTLREEESSPCLYFFVNSPTGAVEAFHRAMGSKRLHAPIDALYRELLEPLQRLLGGEDVKPFATEVPPVRVMRQLRRLGERLFDDFLPAELQRFLASLEDSDVRTILIASDEPYIPWELLRPRRPEAGDERFWCERFQTTRWLLGNRGPSTRFEVRSLACVEAGRADPSHPLEGAIADRDYLKQMASDSGLGFLGVSDATLTAVERAFEEGEIDLWHFAAHGQRDPSEQGHPVIHLTESAVLRACDLDRTWQQRIAKRRPLVFLNLCGGGRQSWSSSGLDGWIRAWVERSGCGGLVAPVGVVEDTAAHLFSKAFYEALRAGATLGEAAAEARREAREGSPDEATWLAYCVYGHPNARACFSGRVEPAE